MFLHIVRFEWRYHTRRLTFAVASAVLLFVGFMSTARMRPGLDIHVNAPYSLSFSMGLLSLAGVFVVTLFCAQSVLRDSEHHMAEIVYTTAVTKARYLFGSYAGMLAATCTTFAFALLGMVLGTVLPGHDPSVLGPFDLVDYLWPFAVLVVPNLVLVGAVLFAIAALLRSALATYVSGVVLYMLYVLTAMLTGSPLIAASSPPTPEGLAMAALLDPFGLSAFFEQTHYWTPVERNERKIVLAGHFLLNRVAWSGLAALIMVTLYRLFTFRLPQDVMPRLVMVDDRAGPVVPRARYRRVTPSMGRLAALWPALRSAIRLETLQLLRSWPFLVLLMMWIGMNAIEIAQFVYNGEFGTMRIPATPLIIQRIREPFMLVGLVILVYYSAEIVWRERVVQIDQIVDATRASNAVFLLSKTVVLTAAIAGLAVIASIVGIVFQLLNGHTRIDLVAYGSQIYFIGLPLALIAFLAIFVQTMSPNRYVGMVMTLAAIAFFNQGAFGGPEHPLLRYAAAPSVQISSMAGFGPAVASFHAFIIYWGIVTCLLAMLAYGLWKRGTDLRLLPRLQSMPKHWNRPMRRGALGLGLLLLLSGGSIFRQTNVVNAYQTRDEIAVWRADYERKYRHLENVAQPTPVHMDLEIDLFPAQRRYLMRGTYRMKNQTLEAIETIWFAARDDVEVSDLSFDGNAPTEVDERFSTYTFALDSPLRPGATADLAYTIAVDRNAISTSGTERDIVANGSFVLSGTHLPRMGYRVRRELADPVARRRHGLAPTERPTTVEAAQEMGLMDEQSMRFSFDLTISTSSEQTVVAPGELRGTWIEGDRRFARFAMDRPAHPLMAYVSARYAVERVTHLGIEIEVYYHPGHETNVPRFLEAAIGALDYFSDQFGPYPHDHLRIVEVPSGRPFTGMAATGTTYYVETAGFLTDLRDADRVDVVTKRVSHEIAHQWWGGVVSPATGPGAPTLVESTARYSELMLLNRRHGPAAVTAALSFELDRYLAGRATHPEVPLYQAQREPFLFYAKGALVMMALHDLIGEAAVNRALRRIVAQAEDPLRSPTSLDLLAALRASASPEHHDLIDQWWKQVVLYDLRVDQAQVEPLADGRYLVSVQVFGGKHAVEEAGERALDMDEELQIAVYTQYPSIAVSHDGLIHSERLRVKGQTEIEMVVAERPRYVSIDPFLRRIERNRLDNVAVVEAVP